MATSDLIGDHAEAEIAWLAGLLEGEGCFQMITSWVSGKGYRYPKIVVNMTDEDVISRAAAMFRTKIYVMPTYDLNLKQQWRASITGGKAAAWMEILSPWLGKRRNEKIQQILEEYSRIESTEIRRKLSCQIATAKRKRDNATGKFTKK